MNTYELLTLIITALSAIGTVSSASIALALARRDMRRRIDAVFIWDDSDKSRFKPTVLVQNTGKLMAVIESISFYYRNERIGHYTLSKDSGLCKYSIVQAGESIEIPFSAYDFKINEPKRTNKPYGLIIRIKLRRGKTYTSKQRYTYEELAQLMFFEGFTSND